MSTPTLQPGDRVKIDGTEFVLTREDDGELRLVLPPALPEQRGFYRATEDPHGLYLLLDREGHWFTVDFTAKDPIQAVVWVPREFVEELAATIHPIFQYEERA